MKMNFYWWYKKVCNSLGISINMVRWLRKQGMIIGKNCEIYQDVDFGSEPYLIKIGNNVRITNGVRMFTHEGGVYVLRKIYDDCKDIDEFAPIIIGNNVHIGINAIIMPGVHIGDNCVIGAGTIVTKNIPDGMIVAGVPGKIISSIDEFYMKHKSTLIHTKNMTYRKKMEYIQKHIGV